MNTLSRIRLARIIKRSQRALIPVALWVSMGGSIIGAITWGSDSKNTIYLNHFPSWVKSTLYLYGNVVEAFVTQLLIFGTPILLAINICWIIYKNKWSNKTASHYSTKYTIKPVSEDSLDCIVRFGHDLVGDNHVDLTTLKERFRVNPNILTALFDLSKEQSILGYFIIYPLNKEAYTSIIAGKICNGRGISLKHICKKFENATALYIGMVGGKEGHAKGYVIHELIERLRPLLANGKLKAVFTRGATEDGIRAVGQWHFQQLTSPSEISVLHVNSSLLDNPRLVRHVD